MKKKEKLELRMYGLVPYNISPIQQSIQFGHAVVEYGLKYFKDKNYQEWAKNHKTFIILNGGTTNNLGEHHYHKWGEENIGSMQKHLIALIDNKIKYANFYEPDLNDSLTAIVFIVDERVFNKEKYPDYAEPPFMIDNSPASKKRFKNFQKIIGKENLFLRGFLPQFKLA